jgi:hypothetical protein
VGKQEQRVGTINTAIPNAILTMSSKPATEASLPPPAARPPAAFPSIVPEPTVRKDGPRSSAEQARHGEYLKSAVHYAMTALATHMPKKVRAGFSRWASHAYTTKLSQKRKITGDQATVLNDREQVYAEQGSGPDGRTHSTATSSTKRLQKRAYRCASARQRHA